MATSLLYHGPYSPFSQDERETIREVFRSVTESEHPNAGELAKTIERHVFCLESMGELLHQYPSPLTDQKLGGKERNLDTLVDRLSQTNPANFDFHAPTRAIIGRAFDMAETNFYRLLWHICDQVLETADARALQRKANLRLRVCLYTKLAEEILISLASDDELEREVRRKAAAALAQIWGERLTYRVKDFFPLLEATWEARQRINVTGGTLLGTTEIFELFKEGCDPEFVEYFSRPDPTEDETEAFREFLFATSAEELDRLANTGEGSVSLDKSLKAESEESATLFYEFFRARFIQAAARRLAGLPGPKHTAEGYVMIAYLRRQEGNDPGK